MNTFIGIGRATRDCEVTTTSTGKTVAKISIAIDRKIKDKGTDFFNIVVWNKLAEICGQYVKKGNMIAVKGEVQNRSYDKDGEKRYITEIIADEIKFMGAKNNNEDDSGMTPIDEDLPF